MVMEDFKVEVITVGKVEDHPDADRLEIAKVYDYPVIIGKGEFKEGDKAVYVPIDSVVPTDNDRFTFLDRCNKCHGKGKFQFSEDGPEVECDKCGGTGKQGKPFKIKAKRLRGIFSMGLLTAAEDEWELGQDVKDILSITKYEPPPITSMQGDCEKDPGVLVYYKVKRLLNYPGAFPEGEEVVITEKLHGCNSRYVFTDERLWVGSHGMYKMYNPENLWWKIVEKYGLEEKLKKVPDIGVYGEVFGQVQNMKYGATNKDPYMFRAFDALDIKTRQFLDYDDLVALLKELDLPSVPVLYRGPWAEELRLLAEEDSKIEGADHYSEGIVIKPVKERIHRRIGRVIMKLHGQNYLLGKKKKKG